jgi:hypothetical protein
LAELKTLCGRYPTTEEGWNSVIKRPANFVCPNGEKKEWNYTKEWTSPSGVQYADGWNQEMTYSSDGARYKIVASHGYFVTDQSPLQYGRYWENPNGGEKIPPLGFWTWTGFYLFIFFGLVGLLCVGAQNSLDECFADLLPAKYPRFFGLLGWAILGILFFIFVGHPT